MVPTNNGMAFADLPENRGRHPKVKAFFGSHIFDRARNAHGIDTALPSPATPWTDGRAERMGGGHP